MPSNDPSYQTPPSQWAETVQDGECLIWTGRQLAGYGRLDRGRDSRDYAHRVAFLLRWQALIPKGMHVCHVCDRPLCVENEEPGIYVIRGISRPRYGHLWLGTPADNAADRDMKGRGGHRQTVLSDDIVIAARSMVAQGTTVVQAANHLGVQATTLYSAVSGDGWKHLPGAIRSRSPRSKFTEVREHRDALIARHQGGESLRIIAESLGIGKSTAFRIISKQSGGIV